jgi:hypothetical protein
MDASPERYPLRTIFQVIDVLIVKKGGMAGKTIYPEESFFKLIFFLPDTPPFPRHTSRL